MGTLWSTVLWTEPWPPGGRSLRNSPSNVDPGSSWAWEDQGIPDSPLWIMKESESDVTQSCPTFCNPLDYSSPCSSVHGIFQARVLEWVAISFSRGASRPRDRPRSPALQADTLPSEPPGKPHYLFFLGHTTWPVGSQFPDQG